MARSLSASTALRALLLFFFRLRLAAALRMRAGSAAGLDAVLVAARPHEPSRIAGAHVFGVANLVALDVLPVPAVLPKLEVP